MQCECGIDVNRDHICAKIGHSTKVPRRKPDTYLVVERLAHERVLFQTHARASVGRHPGVLLKVVSQHDGVGCGVEVGHGVAWIQTGMTSVTFFFSSHLAQTEWYGGVQ